MKLVKRRMVVHIELSPAEYSELTTHVQSLGVTDTSSFSLTAVPDIRKMHVRKLKDYVLRFAAIGIGTIPPHLYKDIVVTNRKGIRVTVEYR